MPKKQKIDKRLKQLFEDIKPEEAPSKRKRTKVTEEAQTPLPESVAAKEKTPKTGPLSIEPISKPRPVKRQTAALPNLETAKTQALEGVGSRMALTFQSGQQEWATLQVLDETTPRAWSEDEQLLVKQVADQLSLALENARLFQETQERAAELARRAIQLKAVADISAAVSTILSLQDLLQASVNLIRQKFDLYHCHIFMLLDDQKTLGVQACGWEDGDPRAGKHGKREIEINKEVSLVARAARTRQPVVINDITSAPDWLPNPHLPKIQSEMAIPLIAGDELLGVLNIHSDKLSFFTDEDVSIHTTLASQIAVAMDNARLFQETQQLNQAIQSSTDSVITTDINGTITQVNRGFTLLTGYTPQEAIGQTTRLLRSGVHPAEFYKDMWQTIMGGEIWHSELVNRRKDGTHYTADQSILPVRDANGNLTGFLSIERDITEKKQAQEEVARFKLGIENSADAVFMTTISGEIIYANPAFESVYGHKPEDVIGKNPRILKSGTLPPERYEHFWKTLLSKQTVSGELTNKAKDGHLVSITGTNSPILDEKGEILGFLAVHHDITNLKKAEEALQRRNTYLSVSAEIGRVITSTLDLNTIFLRTVNLINERFGFYHAAIFIVEETGFNAILREATGEAGAQMKRERHTLAVDSNSIVGKVTAQGTPAVVNNTALDPLHKVNPLLPETKAEVAIPLRVGNRVIGALDIQSTAIDAFTEDDIGVLQTLADQVAVAIDNARSYELSQQAVMEMREIDRLKSQFLANMSHELRTPLNSIIGFSRVILKGIDGPVTELQQQDLTAIYNSGQHLLGLINDILDLSKIEAGKMELAFDEVNMADVTNSVLSTMSGYIKDKSITLRRVIQPNLPTVRADAIRVRQVMLNLLSNAAKFTEEGEIVVDVAVKAGPNGRPEMMVTVTDTGPGIAAQDQIKLFQPFSQVDDSPTRKTGGTGLGLSICQHLIQMHGGRIGVHSAIGKGSTFYFTLPLYRKEKETEKLGSNGKIILAIDDDPQVIGLYERYLQPQGYQVISLTDPARAVERVRQLRPFAVTLDIMMPGIDGWQVLNSLKADPETRDVPVIVCSIIEDQEKGFSLGAADYLVKPILEEDLVNALDRLNADGSIREVLVIDDDQNDLRLLGKMLTDDGRYKPILAQGGVKGWEIISSKTPPQAVILDLFMPDLDGFQILENMRENESLRDIPVIVISGVELSPEQKKQLDDFGPRLLAKGSLNEKELFVTIQRSLQRVPPK